MYEQRNVAYCIAEIAKILLVARGPICYALPKEAVDAAYLMPKKKIPKLTKPEWSHTGSPKRWVSVLQKDGEWVIKKKEENDLGEVVAVKRVYYKKPTRRIIISTLEGNIIEGNIKIVHFKLDSIIMIR